MSDMRPLIAVAPLICAFVCLCPKHVEALSCAAITSRNFDRVDGDADPAKKQQDAEARAALAMLRPIIFRGRLLGPRASVADIGPARELSGVSRRTFPAGLIFPLSKAAGRRRRCVATRL
jgi:hypothetical protein